MLDEQLLRITQDGFEMILFVIYDDFREGSSNYLHVAERVAGNNPLDSVSNAVR